MSKAKQLFFALLGVVAILSAAGFGAFYLTAQQLDKSGKAISDLKADQEAQLQQIAIYEQARQKVNELSFIDDIAQEVLPQSKEQANVIAELRKFASDANISIGTLTFGGGAQQTADPNLSQTTVAEGLKGVRILPTSVVLDPGVNFTDLIVFLKTIEQNQRKMEVTAMTLTPLANDREKFSAATLELNIFLRG